MARAIFFFFSLLVGFGFPRHVRASAFLTDCLVTYQIKPDWTVTVHHRLNLINQVSHVYATQYTLLLDSTQISGLKAYDSTGPLKTALRTISGQNGIVVTFNQPPIGSGKEYSFNLEYQLKDIAVKNGLITEIKIPKLVDNPDINNYQLRVIIPDGLSNLAYINPEPADKQIQDQSQIFTYSKDQISQKGAILAFGDFQVFDFTLKYHLENPSASPSSREIALPPDTDYQEVVFNKLEPLPLSVNVDEDGNWIARYLLEPHQTITITLSGYSRLFSQPQARPTPSENSLGLNLQSRKYWESTHPLIQAKAAQLKTPQSIYNFVSTHLKYGYDLDGKNNLRQGALYALQNPDQSICTEYTDLFIALARAAGIPAREINGFAYTNNENLKPLGLSSAVLHAWPEYWDEARAVWQPVDPTWGNTSGGTDFFSKTDLNHFAFVIHGQNSSHPLPAGYYHQPSESANDVTVTFADYQPSQDYEPFINLDLPATLYVNSPQKASLTISNTGGRAIYQPSFYLKSEHLTISDIKLPAIIPPFSETENIFTVSAPSNLSLGKQTVSAVFNETAVTRTLTVRPQQLFLIVGGALILIFITAGIVAVFMLKRAIRKRHVHQKVSSSLSH